jgi:hypothetical protein
LLETPYSPAASIIQPSAHDVMMCEKLNQELKRIREEYSRILVHFGGALSLASDEEEED